MNQKGFTSIILIVSVLLLGLVGYFIFINKSAVSVVEEREVVTSSRIISFENAINRGDAVEASKYLADNVFLMLNGTECCGEKPQAVSIQYLAAAIKGLQFTFNPDAAAVIAYKSYIASENPNRWMIKDNPRFYFDQYVIGVESDPTQKNKVVIGYSLLNNKITDLFIDTGRDR